MNQTINHNILCVFYNKSTTTTHTHTSARKLKKLRGNIIRILLLPINTTVSPYECKMATMNLKLYGDNGFEIKMFNSRCIDFYITAYVDFGSAFFSYLVSYTRYCKC